MDRKPVIAVIGSGRANGAAVSNARRLGRLIAERGWIVVSGGRDAGVMAAASEGASQAGGLVVGILPDRSSEISPAVDVAIVTGVGEARNNIIVLSADVVIACGVEDAGTSSEAALALKAGKPLVLLGVSAVGEGFFGSIDSTGTILAASPEEAVLAAENILRASSSE